MLVGYDTYSDAPTYRRSANFPDAPGNAHTEMAAGHTEGALQPNGSIIPEDTIDAKHVANAVVHIASLPLNVTVLEMNIMYVLQMLAFQLRMTVDSL